MLFGKMGRPRKYEGDEAQRRRSAALASYHKRKQAISQQRKQKYPQVKENYNESRRKKYREQHPPKPKKTEEEKAQVRRQWRQANKDQLNTNNANYNESHREEIHAQQKDYYRKNKSKRLDDNRSWDKRLREKLLVEIGSICVVCGRKEHIQFHDTKLRDHSNLSKTFILKHKEDFLPMCVICHRVFHYFLRHREKFEELLSKMVAFVGRLAEVKHSQENATARFVGSNPTPRTSTPLTSLILQTKHQSRCRAIASGSSKIKGVI